MKKRKQITTFSNLKQKPLTSENIKKAINNLDVIGLRIKSIEFSKCDRFIKIFENIIKKQISIVDVLYGIPVLKRDYVPEDEVWFIGNYREILKRFKFSN